MIEMMTRHNIRKDSSWGAYGQSLIEVIQELQQALGEVPIQYQQVTKISIEGAADYDDDHRVTMEIFYDAPETEEEKYERETSATKNRIHQLAYHEEQIKKLRESPK
jgi:hypothetical protein